MNTRICSVFYRFIPKFVWDHYGLYTRTRPTHKINCPICGYIGFFDNYGSPPRLDALCPSCGSLERHRLFSLFLLEDSSRDEPYIHPKIIHFAAEPALERRLRSSFNDGYQTADLTIASDLQIDIESIQMESGSISTVICLHVLEHVDDKKALAELYRIMSPNSTLILGFPIIEGWDLTYENPEIESELDRLVHFGQFDHIRYFGADVRKRIENQGYEIVQEYSGTPEMCIRFGLQRGEKLFVCRSLIKR